MSSTNLKHLKQQRIIHFLSLNKKIINTVCYSLKFQEARVLHVKTEFFKYFRV